MARGRGIWNPVYVSVLSFEIVSQFANYLVNPIVANYAVAMGTAMGVAGFVAGLNSAVSLVLRPWGGLVFSRFGRKRLLVAAAALFAASSLVCAAFDAVATLALSRVLMGMAFVLRSTLVVALAASVVPKDCVGQGVGIVGLAGIVSNALAPGIGSWIGFSFGYRFSFLASSLLFMAALVIAISLKDPDKVDSDSEKRQLVGRPRLFYAKAIPIALVAGLSSFVFGSVNALIMSIGEERGIVGASAYFFTYALFAIAMRPLVGKAFDRYGLGKLFVPGALLTCASMIVLALSFDSVSVAAGGALLALGQGSIYPCCQAESVRGVPIEKSALAANTFYLGPDAGMAAGPLVGGVILQLFGPCTMFALNVGVTVLMILLYFVLFRKKEQLKGSDG